MPAMAWIFFLINSALPAQHGSRNPTKPATVASRGLAVTVSVTGEYSVSVDGVRWLVSAPPDHLGRALSATAVTRVSGSDRQGAFEGVAVRWAISGSSEVVLVTSFRGYHAGREMLALTQSWPAGVVSTSSFYNHTTSQDVALGRFPAFEVGLPGQRLNFLTFEGCQIQYSKFGRWASSGQGHFAGGGAQQTMPLLLYNRSLRSIAISPAGHYFNAVHETAGSGGSVLAAGPQATVATLPKGFNFTTFIVGGSTVNGTMAALGKALLAQTGKIPVDVESGGSFVLSHLGFWVDNVRVRPVPPLCG
jgi:hypothetical protein